MSAEAQAVMNTFTGARAFLPSDIRTGEMNDRLWIVDQDGGAWWHLDKGVQCKFFPNELGSHYGAEVDVPDWFNGNLTAYFLGTGKA